MAGHQITEQGGDSAIPTTGFESVDTNLPDRLIRYLDQVAQDRFVQRYVELSLSELNLRQGSTLLDLGVGTAHDLRELASAVGASGQVILVDSSQQMIDVASAKIEKLHLGETAATHCCDAANLPLPDDSVDGARIVRTLMHVPVPDETIAEMARVLKPGGKLVCVEPDWGSVITNTKHQDVMDGYLSIAEKRVPHPFIGRELARKLDAAGLTEIKNRPLIWEFTDPEIASNTLGFESRLTLLRDSKVISDAQYEEFFRDIEALKERGIFSATVNFHVVSAKKPNDNSAAEPH